MPPTVSFFFFFNDTATTEIYTLSLHDALPISFGGASGSTIVCSAILAFSNSFNPAMSEDPTREDTGIQWKDRKSTRLNSSHLVISYAVFCLKKKKKQESERTVGSIHNINSNVA